MAYETLASHRPMALDARRNDAYAAALARVITPHSVVLDLGAGTGVLGLIAARLGARRVYLVEPSDVIVIAEEIAAANRLGDVVQVLHGKLEDVTIPEKVDVIISVMTGNFLLSEDLLPVLFQARDTYLKPGGHLIPDMAVMEAVLVTAPGVHATYVADWSNGQHGVDLAAARTYAANTMYSGPTILRDSAYAAEPCELLTLDLNTATYSALHAKVEFDVIDSSLCHGLAGWFRIRLGDAWLSTSPRSPATHWSSVYLPVDPPLVLERGDRVSLAVDRLPEGDWSWRLKSPRGDRRHSTLLGAPLTPGTLQKASQTYVPTVTDAVAATTFVLAAIDGAGDVAQIARRLHETFPVRYPSFEAALAFTQRVVAQF